MVCAHILDTWVVGKFGYNVGTVLLGVKEGVYCMEAVLAVWLRVR